MKTLRKISTLCASFTCVFLFGASIAQADIEPERKTELLNFLEQDCGSCHGLKRTGGLGSPLLPERLDAMDDATLADIILNGIAETAMPPWKEILSEEEAYFLIKQLRDGLKTK